MKRLKCLKTGAFANFLKYSMRKKGRIENVQSFISTHFIISFVACPNP